MIDEDRAAQSPYSPRSDRDEMPSRTRLRIEVGIIALLFGAGAGWGVFQSKLGDLDARLTRIDERVSAMYCSQIPEAQRPACR